MSKFARAQDRAGIAVSAALVLVSILAVRLAAAETGGADSDATMPPNQITPSALIGYAVEKLPDLPRASSYAKKSDESRDAPWASAFLDGAIKKFTANDIAGAREFVNDATKTWPGLPPAQSLMAKMYLLSGDVKHAREELESCASAHPDDPEAFLLLGAIALDEENRVESRLLFQQAEKLVSKMRGNPSRQRECSRRAGLGLAGISEFGDRYAAVEKLLDGWIKRDPRNPIPHYLLAVVMFHGDRTYGKSSGARRAYEQLALAHNAGGPVSADLEIAQLYAAAHLPREAEDFLSREIRGSEKWPAEVQLASLRTAWRLAHQLDSLDAAKECAERALKLEPKSLDAAYRLAVTSYLLGDAPSALKLMDQAYAESPANFRTSNLYALLLAERGDREEQEKAVKIARANFKLYGGQEATRADSGATLAYALFNNHQERQAEKIVKLLGDSCDSHPEALYICYSILDEFYWGDKGNEAIQSLAAAMECDEPFIHRTTAEWILAALQ